MQGIAQLDQRSESGLTQFGDHAQKTRRQLLAFPLVEMFFQQQITELLFKPLDQFQRCILLQISR
jgi:hypothetical protein